MEDKTRILAEIISSRRSCRRYRQDAVPQEILEQIVELGRLAPSGSNMQTTHFIVIKSIDKLAELRRAVTAALADTIPQGAATGPLAGLIEKAKESEVDVIYSAPALILTANRKDCFNAFADCACALENIMLAATANGLGSCWINMYTRLGEAPALIQCLKSFGMGEDEFVCGAIALGYSDNIETTPLPRTGNPVTYV